MNIVKVRNLIIGEGRPKICIPIMGRTDEEMVKEVVYCNKIGADLIEIRIDHYKYLEEDEKVLNILSKIRSIYRGPILFTLRSHREGGVYELDDERYFTINKLAIKSGYIDLVDVELFMPENISKELIDVGHKNKVRIIMSNHDFEKTLAKDIIISRLCKMQDMKADIVKIAQMPNRESDVLELLSATLEMKEKYGDRPCVTISMGSLGKISRISGGVFGSSITFGTIDKSSAPGQIDVENLEKIIDLLKL